MSAMQSRRQRGGSELLMMNADPHLLEECVLTSLAMFCMGPLLAVICMEPGRLS